MPNYLKIVRESAELSHIQIMIKENDQFRDSLKQDKSEQNEPYDDLKNEVLHFLRKKVDKENYKI